MRSAHGRGIVLHASFFSREAAFLLDAMAALPRKWVSGGLRLVAYASESAPTLPWQTIALPRGGGNLAELG